MSEITVCIPSIPPRAESLRQALDSVAAQTRTVNAIVVAYDSRREGAPATRDRALAAVQTDLVAFLDDDDELKPEHLELLEQELERTGADLVYPWFDVVGGTDPFPQWEGQPWDNAHPHQVPVTYLAHTDAIRAVGGFNFGWTESQAGTDELGHRAGEDYLLICRLAKYSGRIVHLPQRTWLWHHHASNTMGLPSRW